MKTASNTRTGALFVGLVLAAGCTDLDAPWDVTDLADLDGSWEGEQQISSDVTEDDWAALVISLDVGASSERLALVYDRVGEYEEYDFTLAYDCSVEVPIPASLRLYDCTQETYYTWSNGEIEHYEVEHPYNSLTFEYVQVDGETLFLEDFILGRS